MGPKLQAVVYKITLCSAWTFRYSDIAYNGVNLQIIHYPLTVRALLLRLIRFLLG